MKNSTSTNSRGKIHSIGTRLAGAILLLCIFTVVAGGIGLYSLSSVDTIRRESVERLDPMMTRAADIRSSAETLRAAVSVALGKRDAEALTQARAVLAETESAIPENLNQMAALEENEEKREALLDLKSNLAGFFGDAESVIAAIESEVSDRQTLDDVSAKLEALDASATKIVRDISLKAESDMNGKGDQMRALASTGRATVRQLSGEIDTVPDQPAGT